MPIEGLEKLIEPGGITRHQFQEPGQVLAQLGQTAAVTGQIDVQEEVA